MLSEKKTRKLSAVNERFDDKETKKCKALFNNVFGALETKTMDLHTNSGLLIRMLVWSLISSLPTNVLNLNVLMTSQSLIFPEYYDLHTNSGLSLLTNKNKKLN